MGRTARESEINPEVDTSRGKSASSTEYHQFTDRATGTHEFAMGGAERATEEWMMANTNANELIQEASDDPAAYAAFEDWVRGDFMKGQQYWGWDRMPYWAARDTVIFDEYIDRSVVHAPVSIMRLATPELLGLGKGKPTPEQLQALVGSTVVSKGNMSCAAAGTGLTISWDANPGRVGKYIEYKFNIPGGTKGAGMWIGDKRINEAFGAEQREFMMNRDTEWRVGRATYDAARGCYVVEMDWVGRHAHDYGTTGKP